MPLRTKTPQGSTERVRAHRENRKRQQLEDRQRQAEQRAKIAARLRKKELSEPDDEAEK
jgi:hypothetical protein